eukprot:4918574-Prymnesium_polylepis.1
MCTALVLLAAASIAVAAVSTTPVGTPTLSDWVKAAGGGGTVKVGQDANGVRGLLASCDARVG